MDETVVLELAPRSFSGIVHRVFVEKGGAPLHFFVEHVTLAWPGGVEGLRLPSLAFFLLALPAAALVARELSGRPEAMGLAVVLALAPLAVELATFARMYSLFLAATLWATYAALWAAREGGWLRWALAGASAGVLVYVHPIAPVYAALALATGLVVAERSVRRLAAEAWPGIVALVAVGIPYYTTAFSVVRDRYGVHRGNPRLGTTHGRMIPEESLHALTPGGTVGAIVVSLLALGGLAWLLYTRRRSGLALGLWLLPILFFTVVPVGGTRFFDRYLIPIVPAFLLLAVVGCVAIGRLAGRRPLLALALVAGLAAWEGVEDVRRLADLRALGIRDAVAAVSDRQDDGTLFATSGTFLAGRYPGLLGRYLELEIPRIERVREDDPEKLAAYVREEGPRRTGLWLFRGTERRTGLVFQRIAAIDGVRARLLSDHLILVESSAPESRERLLELGVEIRRAWSLGKRGDRGVEKLIRIEREALDAAASP